MEEVIGVPSSIHVQEVNYTEDFLKLKIHNIIKLLFKIFLKIWRLFRFFNLRKIISHDILNKKSREKYFFVLYISTL